MNFRSAHVDRRAIAVCCAMLATAAAAIAAKPSEQIIVSRPAVQLENMVPAAFGEWRIDPEWVQMPVAPDVKEKIDQIYTQVLMRTYVNGRGERIMLSISYGGDQTGRLRVHRPESCYAAQGFEIKKISEDRLTLMGDPLPVNRLMARQGPRNEPITYWIRVGDSTVVDNIGQRLAQLGYGLSGKVPDGMIVRVSSITPDPRSGYQLHDSFLQDLVKNMTPADRAQLIGTVM